MSFIAHLAQSAAATSAQHSMLIAQLQAQTIAMQANNTLISQLLEHHGGALDNNADEDEDEDKDEEEEEEEEDNDN